MSKFTLSKGPLDYAYIKLSIEHERNLREPLEGIHFKSLIVKALTELFGVVGAAMPIDVIKFDVHKKEGILRVHQRDIVNLWSSLTLYEFTYCGISSVFRVEQVTSHLMALAADSRRMKLKLLADE